MQSASVDEAVHPVILFDGVCNLCNGLVNFIISRDTIGRFHFASLQSEYAQKLLLDHEVNISLDTVIVIDEHQIYRKSDAVLQIFRGLSGGWQALFVLRVVPKRIRDAVYHQVAKYRYRIFGKRSQCMVPSEDIRSRFEE